VSYHAELSTESESAYVTHTRKHTHTHTDLMIYILECKNFWSILRVHSNDKRKLTSSPMWSMLRVLGR